MDSEEFKYVKASDEDIRSFAKQMLADSIWKESNVELASSEKPITFPDTLSLLEDVTPKGLDIDTVLIVKNLRDAWKKMLSRLDDDLLNLEFICDLNYEIGAGLFRPAGELRKNAAFVRGATYQPSIPTKEEICLQIEELKQIPNPINQAFEAFCCIARGQWFIDGNKRTAQVFMNSLLVKSGVGVAAVKQEDIPDFFNILINFYNSGESHDLKQFLYNNCLIKANF